MDLNVSLARDVHLKAMTVGSEDDRKARQGKAGSSNDFHLSRLYIALQLQPSLATFLRATLYEPGG